MASGQVDELARWKELGQRAADTASRGAGGLQSPLGLPLLHRSITQVGRCTLRMLINAPLPGESEPRNLRVHRPARRSLRADLPACAIPPRREPRSVPALQVAEQTSRLQPSARGEDEDAVLVRGACGRATRPSAPGRAHRRAPPPPQRATRILAGQGLDLPRLRGQLSAVQVAHQAGAPGPSRPLSRLLSAAAGPDPDRFSSSLAAACLHAAAHESLSAAQAAFCSMMDGAAVGAGDARRGAALALMPATAAGPEVAAARRGLAQAGVAGAVLVEGSLEWRYLGAVRELNEGRAGGRSAAEVLGAAAGSGAGAGEGEGGDGGVARLWALLAAMVAALREAGGPGGAAGPAVAALARGARQALEKEHMAFVDKVSGDVEGQPWVPPMGHKTDKQQCTPAATPLPVTPNTPLIYISISTTSSPPFHLHPISHLLPRSCTATATWLRSPAPWAPAPASAASSARACDCPPTLPWPAPTSSGSRRTCA